MELLSISRGYRELTLQNLVVRATMYNSLMKMMDNVHVIIQNEYIYVTVQYINIIVTSNYSVHVLTQYQH